MLIRKAASNTGQKVHIATNTVVIQSGGECGSRDVGKRYDSPQNCHSVTGEPNSGRTASTSPFPMWPLVNFDVGAWAGRYRRGIMAPNRVTGNLALNSTRPVKISGIVSCRYIFISIKRKREILPVDIQRRRGGKQSRVQAVMLAKRMSLGFTQRFDEP